MPFFVVFTLGAFNDNALKNALAILIIYQDFHWLGMKPAMVVNFSAGLFVLPFFLFSAFAGQLADKFEKSKLILFIKGIEALMLIIAAAGFYFNSMPTLIFVLFLLGLQSTLFGPVKYSILPQYLHEKELLAGNGLTQMGTFIAILFGTISSGLFINFDIVKWLVITMVVLSLLGWGAAFFLPHAPSPAPKLKLKFNPITQTWATMKACWQFHDIFVVNIAISWFWCFGAIFISQIPPFAKYILYGDTTVVTYFLALFSIGIGIGAMLCDKILKQKADLGLVILGMIGLSLFCGDIYFATKPIQPTALVHFKQFITHSYAWRLSFDVIMATICAGFYTVPLYTILQRDSNDEYRSRMIAANNILNAAFMVIAAIIIIALLKMNMNIAEIYLFTAIANALFGIGLCTYERKYYYAFRDWVKHLINMR